MLSISNTYSIKNNIKAGDSPETKHRLINALSTNMFKYNPEEMLKLANCFKCFDFTNEEQNQIAEALLNNIIDPFDFDNNSFNKNPLVNTFSILDIINKITWTSSKAIINLARIISQPIMLDQRLTATETLINIQMKKIDIIAKVNWNKISQVTISRAILNKNFYFNSIRHYFCNPENNLYIEKDYKKICAFDYKVLTKLATTIGNINWSSLIAKGNIQRAINENVFGANSYQDEVLTDDNNIFTDDNNMALYYYQIEVNKELKKSIKKIGLTDSGKIALSSNSHLSKTLFNMNYNIITPTKQQLETNIQQNMLFTYSQYIRIARNIDSEIYECDPIDLIDFNHQIPNICISVNHNTLRPYFDSTILSLENILEDGSIKDPFSRSPMKFVQRNN